MSTENNNIEAGVADIKCCASCGTKETSEIKLKKCTACYLVQYCGINCQKKHRRKHKRECKQRAAELRDEILFRQPECSHFGDCPICCLPIPLDGNKHTRFSCCCALICDGCTYANQIREFEHRLEHTCPFCRKPVPKMGQDVTANMLIRAEANDPVALKHLANEHHEKGEYDLEFKYLIRAAKLGDAAAHYNLSLSYRNGQGVEMDNEKETYHSEEAAIAGHLDARHNLGCDEYNNKRYGRAVRHFIIAANLGSTKSINELKECYKEGLVNKDDLALALRSHQAAVDATKSPQRDAAEEFMIYET